MVWLAKDLLSPLAAAVQLSDPQSFWSRAADAGIAMCTHEAGLLSLVYYMLPFF